MTAIFKIYNKTPEVRQARLYKKKLLTHFQALLDKVFIEIEFRSLQRIQDEMIVCEGEITSEEIISKNLHTTQRLVQFDKVCPHPHRVCSFTTPPAALGIYRAKQLGNASSDPKQATSASL